MHIDIEISDTSINPPSNFWTLTLIQISLPSKLLLAS